MSFFCCRIIPNLYFSQDNSKESTLINKAIEDKNNLLEMLDEVCIEATVSKKLFIQNMPFPYCKIENYPSNIIKNSLSRIIQILHKCLLTTSSKYYIVSTSIKSFTI